MRKSLRLATLSLLVLGAAAFLFYSLRSAEPSAAVPPHKTQKQLPVRTERVSLGASGTNLTLVGKLASRQAITLSPEVSGRLVELPVGSGAVVKAGQLLARLDDGKQLAALAQAEAVLKEARRKLREMQQLTAPGAVAVTTLAAQKASVEQASAQRDQAGFDLSQRHLVAPFAGQVGLLELSPGAQVVPGDVLLTLDDTAVMRLDLAIPEPYLAVLGTGMRVSAVTAAHPGHVFEGRVAQLDSRLDPDSLTLKARVLFDNARHLLKPGMLMSARLEFERLPLPLIPAQAIEFVGQERFVYRLEAGGVVHRLPVTLGAAVDSRMSVLSGLKEGDRIVTEGLVNLHDGSKVRDLAGEGS